MKRTWFILLLPSNSNNMDNIHPYWANCDISWLEMSPTILGTCDNCKAFYQQKCNNLIRPMVSKRKRSCCCMTYLQEKKKLNALYGSINHLGIFIFKNVLNAKGSESSDGFLFLWHPWHWNGYSAAGWGIKIRQWWVQWRWWRTACSRIKSRRFIS